MSKHMQIYRYLHAIKNGSFTYVLGIGLLFGILQALATPQGSMYLSPLFFLSSGEESSEQEQKEIHVEPQGRGSYTVSPFLVPDWETAPVSLFDSVPSGLTISDISFADINNDNSLDVLLTGLDSVDTPFAAIYLFSGGAYRFDTTWSSALPPISDAKSAWGDYDNDGDIDLALVGQGSSALFAGVFRNEGNSFLEVTSPMIGVAAGDIDWVDIDNDGYLDLSLMGTGSAGPVTQLLRNRSLSTPADPLEDVSFMLPGTWHKGAMAWSDYNKDGRVDVAIVGESLSGDPITQLFRNEGEEIWAEVENTGITALSGATGEWGDYNNDGYPDLLLSGFTNTNDPFLGVFRNNANDKFTRFTLAGVGGTQANWGDLDEDGDLDVWVLGDSMGVKEVSHIYANVGGNFSIEEENSSFLVDVASGAIGQVDYDKDGQLDLFITGQTSAGENVFEVYHNLYSTPTPKPRTPSIPQNLSAEQRGDTLFFYWEAPGPAQYPANLVEGLTYNLYVGIGPNQNALSGNSSLATGFRKVIRSGNVYHETRWSLIDLPSGLYNWGVQSVDADYEGSTFVNGPTIEFINPNWTLSTRAYLGESASREEVVDPVWINYDLDQDLDLLFIGSTSDPMATRLFENLGDTLVEVFTPFPTLSLASSAWGDFNRDGLPDLALMGSENGTPITQVFQNQGGGNFIAVSGSFQGAQDGTITWLDYDNDGDEDLLYVGSDGTSGITRLYQNDMEIGQTAPNFSVGVSPFPDLEGAHMNIVDVDSDGDRDIFVMGTEGVLPFSGLFLNDGLGVYSQSPVVFPAASDGISSWADFDNDGDPDLLLSGTIAGSPTTLLLRNDNQVFASVATPFANVAGGDILWGDVNFDGYRDVLLTGLSSGGPVTEIYLNSDSSIFAADPIGSGVFPKLGSGSRMALGDIDGNNSLDLAFSGPFGSMGATYLITNLYSTLNNTQPEAPSALNGIQVGRSLTLSWSPPQSGDISLISGYTYNVRVGTSRSAVDLTSPLANTTTGRRFVVSDGSNHQANSLSIEGLSSNTYYWSVQAIDQDFEGSAFAVVDSVDFFIPLFLDSTSSYFSTPPSGLIDASFAWGDYDNDSHLDLILSGETTGGKTTQLFRNTGTELVPSNITVFADVSKGSLDWTDYDGDGFIDLLLTGESNNGLLSVVYRNNGDQTFTPISLLEGISDGEGRWIDWDSDGDQDILISGSSASGPTTLGYINDSTGTFTVTDIGLPDLEDSRMDLGDFDKDGFVDVLLCGRNTGGFAFTGLFRNRQGSRFEDTGVPLGNVLDGEVAFVDFDSDGFPDIATTGESNTGLNTRIYINSGGTSFSELLSLKGIKDGSMEWGDYNNDGLQDVLLLGFDGNTASDRTTEVFRNVDGNQLVPDDGVSAVLPDVAFGKATWGDYDEDGKLDIVLAGEELSGDFTVGLFHNEEPSPATSPLPPGNLSVQQEGKEILFTWEPPQGVSAALALGYSYNLYINPITDPTQALPANADISSGYRKIVGGGNAFQRTTYRLQGLEEGTYSWAVQTIDGDYEGSNFTQGQEFTYIQPDFDDLSPSLLPDTSSLSRTAVAWGDANADNFLDILVLGEGPSGLESRLYRNVGGASFEAVSNLSIDGVRDGFVEWGDYDNDGDLDVIVLGETLGGGQSSIYRNDGNNEFIRLPLALEQVRKGSADWGDYDNDGDLDLVLMGERNDQSRVTRIYENLKNDNFQAVEVNLPGLSEGSVEWGDMDNDDDLDLLLSGRGTGGPTTVLFQNNGVGVFEELFLVVDGISPLENIWKGNASWGDFNNDGFHDILLSGTDEGGDAFLGLYVNNSNGNFSDFPLSLSAPIDSGRVAWGDFNEDGFRDLVFSGSLAGDNRVVLVSNQSGASFQMEMVNSVLFGLKGEGGYPAWADYDKDGKLDLLLTRPENGTEAGDVFIYKNVELTPNVTPGTPTNLQFVPDNEIITLSWDPPLGTGSRVNGYTYNLFVARQSGGDEFQSPMANLATGFRRIASSGAIKGNSWQLKGFSAGNYVWRVQAIDQDLEGSLFSVADTFSFTPPDLKNETVGVLPNEIEGISQCDLVWVDINSDDRLDLFMMGNTDQGRSSRVYLQGNTGFNLTATSIEGVSEGQADWADLNNDGLMDLGIVGLSDTGAVSLVYINELNGLGSPTLLEGLRGGSIDFGDYDNDGYRDILITGANSQGLARSLIYRNQGFPNFTFELTHQLLGIIEGDAKWADINRDGWLDLALFGNQEGLAPTGRMYFNDRKGGFVLSENTLTGVENASIDWGDYDADGWVDLLVSGLEGPAPRTRIYKNLGNSQFSSVALLDGIYDGDVGWGDFNDDGYPDVAITGNTDAGSVSSLFRNINGITFEWDSLNSVSLINVGNGSSLAWGDYDKDGKLDLVIGGESDSSTNEIALFKNFETTGNRTPPPPFGLVATPMGEKLSFSWSRDTIFDPALVDGLTYNLFIGTATGAVNRRSPMSKLSDGFRKVVKIGAIADTTWCIEGLPTGTYHWSVQSIDTDFEGSDFAPEQTVQFTLPAFTPISEEGGLQDSLLPVSNPALAWGDFDNDRDLDLLVSGESAGDPSTILYENLGSSSGNLLFSPRDVGLDPVQSGSITWADYNRDGFLDFVLTGESAQGLVTKIYKNDSTRGFIDIDAGIPGLKEGSTSWGDLDNDGDLDLILSGQVTGGSANTSIYLNQGEDDFSLVNLGLPSVQRGSVQWVDFDSDGFMDIFLTGEGTNGPLTSLYKNLGNKRIELFATDFLDLSDSDAFWGDINNDGFPDLILAGVDAANEKHSLVYRNDAGTGFSELSTLIGIQAGDIELNDFDEDGFQDILLVGNSDTLTPYSFLYRNLLGLGFELDTTNSFVIPSLTEGGRVAWADMDNDGKTDFALLGSLQSPTDSALFELFKNRREGSPDNAPLPPGQVSLQPPVKGPDRVTLSWGPTNTPSKASGYTYNLFVGTEPGKDDIISAQADFSTGKLKFVGPGNRGHATSIELRNLAAGTYYWGVQSVDQEYESSPFQFPSPDTFNFTPARFIEVTDNVIPFETLGFTEGDIDLGDFDNDNNLDILYAGATDSGFVTKVLKNIGQSRFEDSGIELPGLTEASVAWGDYNNDGYLDAVISGFDGTNSRTILYENVEGAEGERSLQEVPGEVARFADLRNGSLDWGDFDNDGFLDLLLVGRTDQLFQTTAVYWNRRGINGKYFEGAVFAAGLANSSAQWGDVDNDGDLDILVNGSTGVIRTQVILNDCEDCLGNDPNLFLNTLSSVEDSILQLHKGSVEWGDWDNDGDLDVLITGEDVALGVHTRVYTNLGEVEGEVRFTDAGFSLPGVADGEARWADYNEDGFLDIILSGRNGPGEEDRTTALLSYDPILRNYVPDDLANSILKSANSGVALSWGDYDGDGLLDLFTSGDEGGPDPAKAFRVFQNKTGESTPPLPPVDLLVTQSDQPTPTTFDLNLKWSPPGNSGDTLGYSYNLVFNRVSPSGLLVSPLSDTLSGTRRVVRIGNVDQATEWTIKGIPEGTYSWQVQSIDQSLEGSEFSLPNQVILEIPSFEDVTATVFDTPPTPLADGDLIMGDVDNDEDIDVFVTGVSGSGEKEAQLYIYSKTQGDKYILSSFSENIEGITHGQAAWGDYDLDGDLDLLVSGENAEGNPTTTIYENFGESNFVADTSASSVLPQVLNSSVAWGDFNRDGFPDILITGNTGNGKVAALYENNGNKSFEEFRSFGGVDRGSVAFGDYNRDSNLDFIITGLDGNGSPVTNVFRNTFNRDAVEYGFQNVEVNIQFRAFDSSIDWEDVNNDGYLDLLLTGTDFLQRTSGALFIYNPLTSLYQASSIPTRVSNGEVSLGDYNFDGFRDLLITGENEQGNLDVQVAPNTQNEGVQFGQDVRSTSKLIQVERSSSKWGEIGRPDGKLDIFLAGVSDQGEPVFRVYENVRPGGPAEPPVVSNLQGSDAGLFVELAWEAPADIDSILVNGLTYNLLLEREVNPDSTTLRVNPLSEVSTESNQAIRRVIELGNLGHATSSILTQIPTGTYRWAIQVIGANHEGGPFVFAENTFNFSAPVPDAPISQSIPLYFDWGEAPVQAWVEVDPSQLALIQEIQVKYKPISREGETFQSLTLDKAGNRFTFNISNTVGLRDIDAAGRMIGLEYYFDVIGRFAADEIRTPTYYTYIRFPGGSTATNFTNNGFLTAGSEQQSYQMFTIPLKLKNSGIQSVLSALRTYDKTQWRLFSTENEAYVEYQEDGSTFNEFEVGKAYWIIFRNTPPNFGPGEGTTVTVTEENPFSLTLNQGWNQIGNPYNFAVSWMDVLDYNRETIPDIEQQIDPLAVFQSRQLVISNESNIPRFRGALLFSHTQGLTLDFPIWKDNGIQLRKSSVPFETETAPNPIHFANWQVDLTATSGKGEQAVAQFGMDRHASLGRDSLDRMRPPRFSSEDIPFFDITFEHPEYFYPYFSADIVPSSNGYVWEFYVEASDPTQEVELSWDNSEFGSSSRKLILYEKDTERILDMTTASRMLSNSGKPRRNFQIIYGDAAYVEATLTPSAITLGKAYPNPFTQEVHIPFTLTEINGNREMQVEMRMFNMIGQEVDVILQGQLAPGFHEVTWDGKDRGGNAVSPGTYFYRVKIISEGKSYHYTGKLQRR